MKKIRSCGIFLFSKKRKRFLLLKHPDRWDLPKGHIEKGESDIECALREFEEETGISRDRIEINPYFRYVQVYYPKYKKLGSKVRKTLIIFLANLITSKKDTPVVLSEHIGHKWFKWKPPHKIQTLTIDPLLREVEKFAHQAETQLQENEAQSL